VEKACSAYDIVGVNIRGLAGTKPNCLVNYVCRFLRHRGTKEELTYWIGFPSADGAAAMLQCYQGSGTRPYYCIVTDGCIKDRVCISSGKLVQVKSQPAERLIYVVGLLSPEVKFSGNDTDDKVVGVAFRVSSAVRGAH
jgi:hypothetical protein